jgi:starch-binding outer membrane protein, SusD/RagB family
MKIMKKPIHYLLLLIFLAACSDTFTELTPLGNVTTGNFCSTTEDAIAAANGLYQHWDDDNLFGRGFM